MTEKEAWKAIFLYEKKHIDSRVQRVENLAANGMPDINGCINGVEFWLELKAPAIPKRATTPLFNSKNHPLMPDQLSWLRRQTIAGGKAGLLICCDNLTILISAYKLDYQILKAPLDEVIEKACCVVYKSIKAGAWETIRFYISRRW